MSAVLGLMGGLSDIAALHFDANMGWAERPCSCLQRVIDLACYVVTASGSRLNMRCIKYAEKLRPSVAQTGMAEMSEQFKSVGAEVYLDEATVEATV